MSAVIYHGPQPPSQNGYELLAAHAIKLQHEKDEWYNKCHANAVLVLDAREERDEARSLAQAGYAKAERAEKMLRHAAAKADQWRECAERLAAFVVPVPADMADHAGCAEALAEFERLKEASK